MSIEMLMKGLDKIEGKLVEVEVLRDRVFQLEQKASGHYEGGQGSKGGSPRGIGASVWTELEKNADLLAKTRSVRLEIKAATDPITTGSGRKIVTGPVGGPNASVLGVQNALQLIPATGITAVEYSRYTGKEGGAAQQATEGAAKSYVRPTHSLITQKSITIAGLTKISRQAMNDRAELVSVVDTVLAREVNVALDAALVNGATDFTGGLEALATAYTSLVYTAMVDAVSEGVSTMQGAGFVPNVVVLNPADWLAITVAKGTANDHYLSGAYLAAMPTELRGLRVVLSPSVDAGKALLMDTTHVELRVSDVFSVEIAYSSDDFEKNLATMLGEIRVIPIFRTVGAGRLITPKAP